MTGTSTTDASSVRPFPILDRLVRDGFCMQVWLGKGSGVWAAIGPYEATVDVLREASRGCSIDWLIIADHLESATWLPWVCEGYPSTALTALEARLASIPDDQLAYGTPWQRAVQQVSTSIFEAVRDCTGSVEKRLHDIPESWVQYLKDQECPVDESVR